MLCCDLVATPMCFVPYDNNIYPFLASQDNDLYIDTSNYFSYALTNVIQIRICTVLFSSLQFEFRDFSFTETVFIEFYTERITSPDCEEPEVCMGYTI